MTQHEQEDLVLNRDNPWPGLQAFSEHNAAFFFGRGKELNELKSAVLNNTLTVLFGKSGLGKSSLLQAGLSPELRQHHYIPVYIRLNHFEETLPLEDQVEVFLEKVIDKYQIDAPKPVREETLWEYFHKLENGWWSKENELLKPVLIFDQFEEIITAGQQNPVRAERCARFLEELEDLVENRPPKALLDRFSAEKGLAKQYDLDRLDYRVVISLREDYLADFEGLRERLRSIMSNRIRLLPLTETQALDVVLKPGGDLIDEQTAKQLIDYVSGHTSGALASMSGGQVKFVEPTLLCVILRELNNQRIASGEAKISASLIEQKRPESIMDDFYRQALSGLPELARSFIQDNLLTASGARNRVSEDDAIQRFHLNEAIISTLINRRIIQRERISNMSWLELTHDTLIPVVRHHAEITRRRKKIKKGILYSTAAVSVVVLILLGSLMVQFRMQEQQILAASKVAAKLSDTLRESQTISDEQRQKFARTLDSEFQQNIAQVPDSDLLKAEYVLFQLNMMETYYQQSRFDQFEDSLAAAEELVDALTLSALSADYRNKISVELMLYQARRAQLREALPDASALLGKIASYLNSTANQIAPFQRRIWALESDYIDAQVEHTRYDKSSTINKLSAISESAKGLISDLTQADGNDQPMRDNFIRTAYSVLFNSLTELQSVDTYWAHNNYTISQSFESHLAAAKPFLTGEHQNLAALFESKLSYIVYKESEANNNLGTARQSLNISINTLNELIHQQPKNVAYRLELLGRLNERLTLTIRKDQKQAEEDVSVLNRLANAISGSGLHPRINCYPLMASAYWSLRFENEKPDSDNVTLDRLYKQASAMNTHCRTLKQLPMLATNFDVLIQYQMLTVEYKKENIANHLEQIADWRTQAIDSIAKLEEFGASKDFIADRKYFFYVLPTNYFKALDEDQVFQLIDKGIATRNSMNHNMLRDRAVNLVWMMNEKARYLMRQENPQLARQALAETARFAVPHLTSNERQLVINAVWSLISSIELIQPPYDQGEIENLTELVHLVATKLQSLDFDAHPATLNSIVSVWKTLNEKLPNIESDAVSSPPEGAIAKIRQLRKFNAGFIDTHQQRIVELKESRAARLNSLYPVMELKDMEMSSIIQAQDSSLTSAVPIGWLNQAVIGSMSSITVMGDDPVISRSFQMDGHVLQRARLITLPFYQNCRMVKVAYLNESGMPSSRYYLQDTKANQYGVLKGSADIIHTANRQCELQLDSRENVSAYLRFFCTFTQAGRGAFLLIDSIEDMNWKGKSADEEKLRYQNLIRPLYTWKADNNENWLATATVNYGHAIFHAKFEIQPNGNVAMLADEPIAENLSVNSFAIALDSGRTSNFTNRLVLSALDDMPEYFSITPYVELLLRSSRQHAGFNDELAFAHQIMLHGDHEAYDLKLLINLVEARLHASPEANNDNIRQQGKALFDHHCASLKRSMKGIQQQSDNARLSICYVMAGDYASALEVVSDVEQQEVLAAPLTMIKAHALMFTGETEQAKTLYLENRETAFPYSDKTWAQHLADDFAKFKQIGMTQPLMQEVSELLNQT